MTHSRSESQEDYSSSRGPRRWGWRVVVAEEGWDRESFQKEIFPFNPGEGQFREVTGGGRRGPYCGSGVEPTSREYWVGKWGDGRASGGEWEPVTGDRCDRRTDGQTKLFVQGWSSGIGDDEGYGPYDMVCNVQRQRVLDIQRSLQWRRVSGLMRDS